MGASARTDIFAFFPETIAIPAGVTIVISPLPGQISIQLKYVSGGSLVITQNPLDPNAPVGVTLQGSSYTINNLYVVGSNEIVNAMYSGPVYLTATGATCVANLLRGRSQGI